MKIMLQKSAVRKALRRTWVSEENRGLIPDKPVKIEDTVISLLIYDIFGGEILKTNKKKGWHFYNRIEGERLDFTARKIKIFPEKNHFEDIPSTPEEIFNLVSKEDYSNFFIRFVRIFEEAVGLKRSQQGCVA
jgi:hypothetical protein